MLTSPTGAGLLYVGYVGSREALGQVPKQQLAWRSSHAKLKNKSKFEILFIYKIVHEKRCVHWWLTTLFFGLSLDISAYAPQTKLSRQTPSAAFICCSKFYCWYKPYRHIKTQGTSLSSHLFSLGKLESDDCCANNLITRHAGNDVFLLLSEEI